VDFALTEDQEMIRRAVAELAARFDDRYWMDKDASREFPAEFYQAVADGGWLGITIPPEYGGRGLGITEAALLMEEVAASGGGMNAASSIHLSIFGMHPVVVHGSAELKSENLPRIATGDLHVCGREANTAKYLCADAGFDAADRALQAHGGMGYA
jgi:acyl-CoA dehydrogenase